MDEILSVEMEILRFMGGITRIFLFMLAQRKVQVLITQGTLLTKLACFIYLKATF